VPLLAVERLDLGALAVKQQQPQPGRRVIATPAVAARERRQARADRLGLGQLLAQLERQLAQQLLGLTDQVLASW